MQKVVKRVYIPPRGDRKLPLPRRYNEFRRELGRGEYGGAGGVLLLDVIGQALADYCQGNHEESEAARWFLANEEGELEAVLAAIGVSLRGVLVPDGVPYVEV